MPSTIFFDTNYIKSFGPSELLSGQLPQKIIQQIEVAFSRGDMIALLETVRLETNAWLELETKKRREQIERAIETLTSNGYSVVPSQVAPVDPVDFGKILQSKNKNIPILKPTIEEYRHGEFRTSFRRPPHPKKEADEEMRDRVMWCQLLGYSMQTRNVIVMVSGDTLFRNGADSYEGQISRIKVVENQTDLDQLLGSFPDHIELVITRLVQFENVARTHGISLDRASIKGIEGLRNVVNPDGTITQRFRIISNLEPTIPNDVEAIMVVAGSLPLRLTIKAPTPIRLDLNVSQAQLRGVLLEPHVDREIALTELRNLIER